MLSDKVLLCAPYRFQFDFLYKSEKAIKNELLPVLMTGLNTQTREYVKYGLFNNFEIVDKESLEKTISELANGDLRVVDNVKEAIEAQSDDSVKALLTELYALTNEKGLQGFDDCRIVDTLTKAYAANFLSSDAFNQLFLEHTTRIIQDYSTWEEYLASCVLGKLFQHDMTSLTVTSKEEFIQDIYNYCLMPINVFSFASYWDAPNLDPLGQLLAQLLEVDFASDKQLVKKVQEERQAYAHVDQLSADFMEKWTSDYFTPDDIDLERYDYLTSLTAFVFWNPIVEKGLDWLFTTPKGDQSAVLMPKEFTGYASTSEFWLKYDKFADLHKSHIMVMLCKVGVAALFTEKEIYHFEKKLFFKKTVVATPWEQAKFDVHFDFDFGLKVTLNGKKVLDMLDVPDFSLVGLSKEDIKAMSGEDRQALEKDWANKLQQVLDDIPNKMKAFQSK